MISKLARIENNIVVNIVDIDLTKQSGLPGYDVDVTSQVFQGKCGIGWTDNGDGTFDPSVYVSVYRTEITAAKFKSMLTDNESANFASSSNAVVQKAVTAMRFDSDRKLDTTSNRFGVLMDAAITEVIIDAARKAVLVQGFLIEGYNMVVKTK